MTAEELRKRLDTILAKDGDFIEFPTGERILKSPDGDDYIIFEDIEESAHSSLGEMSEIIKAGGQQGTAAAAFVDGALDGIIDEKCDLKHKYNVRGSAVQGMDGYSEEDILKIVEDYYNENAGYDANYQPRIVQMTVVGSRTRGEARDGSDLDVLVEYMDFGNSDTREESLFNALNDSENRLEIEGVKVDINPISPHFSRTTAEWLERDVQWRKEDQAKALDLPKGVLLGNDARLLESMRSNPKDSHAYKAAVDEYDHSFAEEYVEYNVSYARRLEGKTLEEVEHRLEALKAFYNDGGDLSDARRVIQAAIQATEDRAMQLREEKNESVREDNILRRRLDAMLKDLVPNDGDRIESYYDLEKGSVISGFIKNREGKLFFTPVDEVTETPWESLSNGSEPVETAYRTVLSRRLLEDIPMGKEIVFDNDYAHALPVMSNNQEMRIYSVAHTDDDRLIFKGGVIGHDDAPREMTSEDITWQSLDDLREGIAVRLSLMTAADKAAFTGKAVSPENADLKAATEEEMNVIRTWAAQTEQAVKGLAEGDNQLADTLRRLFVKNAEVPDWGRSYFRNIFEHLNTAGDKEFRKWWDEVEDLSGGNFRQFAWAVAYKLPDFQIEELMPGHGYANQYQRDDDRFNRLASSLSDQDLVYLGRLIGDRADGRHMTDWRPFDYFTFAREVTDAEAAVIDGKPLTIRQRDILIEEGSFYYDGLREVADEYLNMDYDRLVAALDATVENKQNIENMPEITEKTKLISLLSEILPDDGDRKPLRLMPDISGCSDDGMGRDGEVYNLAGELRVSVDGVNYPVDAVAEKTHIHELYRNALAVKLADVIGDSQGIRFAEGQMFPGEVNGMSEMIEVYHVNCDRNGALTFHGRLANDLGSSIEITAHDFTVEGLEQLVNKASEIRNRELLQPDRVTELALQFRSVFASAVHLKGYVQQHSTLYDELNALVTDGVQQNWHEWAQNSLNALQMANADDVKLNELTHDGYRQLMAAIADELSDEDVERFVGTVRTSSVACSVSDLMTRYDTALAAYEHRDLSSDDPKVRSLAQDLAVLLTARDGVELLRWADNGTRHGSHEPLEMLKASLRGKSVYDADRLLTMIRERDVAPDRQARMEASLPSNLMEMLYVQVLSYYYGNKDAISDDAKAVLAQIDRVSTADGLSKWASGVRTGNTLSRIADLPQDIREAVDELAWQIAESDDLDASLEGVTSIGILNDVRMENLNTQMAALKGQYPDEVLLFRNGQGMTLVGDDARKVAEITGWHAGTYQGSDGKATALLDISADGYNVLAEKDLHLRAVTPDFNIRPLLPAGTDRLCLAQQTIDYNLTFAAEKPVSIETDGSLHIGDFKAKALDFHPTGLDAIAEDGEKLVIRDIPNNYWHPEGTLVVADYINGHRTTIERSLEAPHLADGGMRESQKALYDSYNGIKASHQDEVVLVRQKGFMEAFGEDAVVASRHFGVPLYDRQIDGMKVPFVMIPTEKYSQAVDDDLDINLHVVTRPEHEELRGSIRASLNYSEDISRDESRHGLRAEIYQERDSSLVIRVGFRGTEDLGVVALSKEDADRYHDLVREGSVSDRSDFVLDMAEKYFENDLAVSRQHDNTARMFEDAGLSYTPFFLQHSVEYDNPDSGEKMKFNAFTVDTPYIMLYEGMDGAEKSMNPFMLQDLPYAMQAEILKDISQTLHSDAVRNLEQAPDYLADNLSPEEKVHHLSEELGLDYVPLTLRLPVAVEDYDDGVETRKLIIAHATVTRQGIEVYENRTDSYDGDNGILIDDLPEPARKQITDLMTEVMTSEHEISVFVNTESVPQYALSAVINGDFSGIDDPQDEKDIREFLDKYAGSLMSVRDESASFDKSPAFGKATDCVPVDIVRLVTPKQLREERLVSIVDKKVEAFVQEHLEQPLYAEVDVRMFDDEPEHWLVKFNPKLEKFENGKVDFVCNDINDFKNIVVNGYNGDGAFEDGRVVRILNVEDIVLHDRSLLQKESVSQDKGMVSRVYTDGESVQVKDALADYLDSYVSEHLNNSQISSLNIPDKVGGYVIGSTLIAQDAVRDLMIQSLNTASLNNPGILASLGIDDIEAEAEKIALEAVKAAEQKLQSQKYYAFGEEVPQEQIDELRADGVTDFSSENLERLFHFEAQDNGVPTEDVKFDLNAKIDTDVNALRNTLEKVLNDTCKEHGVEIPVSGRIWGVQMKTWEDAQKVCSLVSEDILRAAGQHDPALAGSTTTDYISEKASELGSSVLQKVRASLGTSREESLAMVDVINGIGNKAYTADEVPVVKEAAIAYLQKYNSDYYQAKGIDIADRVQKYDLADRKDLKTVVSAVVYDLQSEALQREPGILDRYLPNGSTRENELGRVASEVMKYAEGVADYRLNDLKGALEAKIDSLNGLVKEFNDLRRKEDPEYVMKKHVLSYSLRVGEDMENNVALISSDGESEKWESSWMTSRDLFSKLDSVEKELVKQYPGLAQLAASHVVRLANEPDEAQQARDEAARKTQAEKEAAEKAKADAVRKSEEEKKRQKEEKKVAKADPLAVIIPVGIILSKKWVAKDKDLNVYKVHAVINGQKFESPLSKEDRENYFGEKKAVTLEGLVMAHFGKEMDAILGKAQPEAGLQNEPVQKGEPKQDAKQPSEVTQAGLIIAALGMARDHDGQWLNAGGKKAPAFTHDGMVISAYNALMMGLHADANGYDTKVYTTFKDAQADGFSVKKNSSGLPLNWYNRDQYVNKHNSFDVISNSEYKALKDEEKVLYRQLTSREIKAVFNIEQTTMKDVKLPLYEDYLSKENAVSAPEKEPSAVEYADMMREQYKGAIILMRNGDNYEAYKHDATDLSQLLNLTPTRHETILQGDGQGIPVVSIPRLEIARYLEAIVRKSQYVKIFDSMEDQEAMKRFGSAEKIYAKAAELTAGIEKSNPKILFHTLMDTGYDRQSDRLVFNNSRKAPAQEEVSTALQRVGDIYRAAVAYVGGADRLNRSGHMGTLPPDVEKYDALVQELAAGVIMSRQGLPAAISPKHLDMIPFWQRELTENPKVVDDLERDVNDAVKVLSALRKGEVVDYSVMRGDGLFESVRMKQYSIASGLANMADAEQRQAVLVKDPYTKSAAVILPAGASLDVRNEIDGLRKNNFYIALNKEHINDVNFYNAGGFKGLNQPNEFFAGKEVSVVKLQDNTLTRVYDVDLTAELAHSRELDIFKVMPIRDDDGRFALYVRPFEGRPVTVYVDSQVLETVDACNKTIREPESKALLDKIGREHYELVMENPRREAGILVPKCEGVDLSRITDVNLRGDRYNPGSFIMFATIDGVRDPNPVKVTGEQAERSWLSEDRETYNKLLAGQLFKDRLAVVQGQESSEGKTTEEQQEKHVESGVKETAERQEEPRQIRFHR